MSNAKFQQSSYESILIQQSVSRNTEDNNHLVYLAYMAAYETRKEDLDQYSQSKIMSTFQSNVASLAYRFKYDNQIFIGTICLYSTGDEKHAEQEIIYNFWDALSKKYPNLMIN